MLQPLRLFSAALGAPQPLAISFPHVHLHLVPPQRPRLTPPPLRALSDDEPAPPPALLNLAAPTPPAAYPGIRVVVDP